jgi:hypothetical protein
MDTKMLLSLLLELKELIQEQHPYPRISEKWVPRSEVKAFFGYGDTQMGALEKDYNLVATKVGKRKFYTRESIQAALEKGNDSKQ